MLVFGHEDTGKSIENYFVCQPHPSTCPLTTPRPPPCFCTEGGVFPKHPQKFQAEVLVMILSYLNSMYVFYVIYAERWLLNTTLIPNYTNQKFLQVWKP